MTNHTIVGKQMRCILCMFWSGSLIVMGSYKETKQDSWVVYLLAGVFILPLLWIQTRLAQLFPEKNLFEMIFETFGKVLSTIFSIFFIFFSIILASLIVRVFSEFTQVLNMPNTPQTLTMAMMLFVSYWSVSIGPENIGRLSKFLWNIIWFSLVAIFIIGIKNMSVENLKPVLETELKPLLSSTLNFCMLPLGESFLCLSLFSSLKKTENVKKIYILALIGFLAVSLLSLMRNLLILGPTIAASYYFPSYEATSVVSLGDFFTRIEVLIGINLIIAGFIKVSVCLHTASLGLAKILKAPSQKRLIGPCVILCITLAIPISQNTVSMFEWIPYYAYYAIPFEIILPLILWITAEIKNKIRSTSHTAPAASSAGTKT